MVQILERSARTGYLSFAVLLKAKAQGAGERRADRGDHDDPAIVLNTFAIDRRHYQPWEPAGTQNSVAFQAAGDFATEREPWLGRLSFERVAYGVVADGSDAFGQGAPSRHSASSCNKLGICLAAPRKTASNTCFHGCCGNCRPSGRAPANPEKPSALSR
jgi:hypothetical protein